METYSTILTSTLKKHKKIKLISLYKNVLNIECLCGKRDSVKLSDIEKHQVVRCNQCYKRIDDTTKEIQKEKTDFIGGFVSKIINEDNDE